MPCAFSVEQYNSFVFLKLHSLQEGGLPPPPQGPCFLQAVAAVLQQMLLSPEPPLTWRNCSSRQWAQQIPGSETGEVVFRVVNEKTS